MVFTSHIFIYYFLPTALCVYYLLPRRLKNGFLTLASYLFYGWWQPWFVTLMLTSTVVDYASARVISADGSQLRHRRAALAASLAVNLGLLGFFKYFMFTAENLSAVAQLFGADAFRVIQVTLPIGISFYTFQTMSYTIDVYRGVAPPVRRFGDFACFVAMFPQLIAGPIVRYNTVAEQLAERRHTLHRFASGAALFMLGFSKKILLANPLGELADTVFAAEGPLTVDAWFGVCAYAFQIYFDFSGYSEMAIGLGRMFGFELPRNFNAPYLADSISDFWRRWHISLSTFLRDYLYVPLGGNRLGTRRTYLNLAVVMLLGGLWHGASWTFVVWGAFHGVLLAGERALGRRGIYAALPRPFRVGLTFILVLFSWVLFRAASIDDAFHFLAAMVGAGDSSPAAALLAAKLYTPTRVLTMLVGGGLLLQRVQTYEWVAELSWAKVMAVTVLMFWALAEMNNQTFNPFLYFQF